jgi:uncharacterized surface protein with fasciclin (FAS1) repeats
MNPDLSTLKAAVEDAGLEAALQGERALTLFAPNNDAFAALPEGALDAQLADVEQLTAVLTYHVLAGTQLAADLRAGATSRHYQPIGAEWRLSKPRRDPL